MPRSAYKTKQRQQLIDYLRSVEGIHVTASDAYAYLREQGAHIGQLTVYRQLESLVDQGVASKYYIDGTTPACFEYVDASDHVVGQTCFHCKCERCGKLVHLRCEELEGIEAHLRDNHGFHLDPRRTVFYGLCEACARQVG